jgi:hypothetical protein
MKLDVRKINILKKKVLIIIAYNIEFTALKL